MTLDLSLFPVINLPAHSIPQTGDALQPTLSFAKAGL
jgi:hypothetical protein